MATNQKSPDEILLQAIKITEPAEQQKYLDIACNGNESLRAEVESLLKAYAKSGDFLEIPAIDPNITILATPLTEKPGTVIGRYKLLEKIGEGGMAYVYMAEQERPVRRKVALKIVKLGMDTKAVVARFEAERQALALMDHPNIARVFDGGATKTGRPYFVMELVRGIAITDYCDKNNLNTKQRLELFIQVCDAVQHAHQKGIIHRDIKPSNVLVTLRDGTPVPKIIDFGIAKATSQRLTEKTVFTRFAQMIGTPEYMSPEQAEMSELDIDTRTDVYSLGVLLYELLTGVTPFEIKQLRQAGYSGIQRIIRETEPIKPSTKLSTLGQTLIAIAQHRQTTPEMLFKLIRGDLDWIVMRTLEKDRSRRYGTAVELASDIGRHIRSEPVQAGPPTTTYKLLKFIRRNRVVVVTMVAVLITLIAGITGIIAFAFKADWYKQEAIRQRDSARDNLYITQIGLAHREWFANNIARVEQILTDCDPSQRNWEWHYLHRLCHMEYLVLRGHSDEVESVTYSPDGKRIVSTGCNEMKIWDADTGKELSFDISVGNRAVFNPSGKRIAASQSNTIRVWDVQTGKELLSIPAHEHLIKSIAFSPDGTRIASSSGWWSESGVIKIWDSVTGQKLVEIGDRYCVNSITFSPDGKKIVSGSGDLGLLSPRRPGDVKIWDARSGEQIHHFQGHDSWITDVDFSPDGTRLVSAGADRTVRVWDVSTGAETLTIPAHSGWVRCVKYSPDGKYIASGGDDRAVKIWDAKTGSELLFLRGNRHPVLGISFSPDGKHLASADKGKPRLDGGKSVPGEVKVWDLAQAGSCRTFPSDPNFPLWSLSAAISPDGTYIATNTRGWSNREPGKIIIRHINTGEIVFSSAERASEINVVKFSPDGKLVAATADFQIWLWEVGSWSPILKIKNPALRPLRRMIAFNPQGNQVAAIDQREIVIFDVQTGTETLRFTAHDSDVYALAFNPDRKHLLSSTWGQADFEKANRIPACVKIWNIATGALLLKLPVKAGIASFSPDARTIATGDGSGVIRICDAVSGKVLKVLSGNAGCILSIVYSPDGTRIFSGSADQTIKVWDVTSGREILTLSDHTAEVMQVSIDSNGQKLISAASDGTVKIWDASPLEKE